MALATRNLKTGPTVVAANKRFIPELVEMKTFAEGSVTKTLVVGTLMAYNTSTNLWVEFANAGANETNIIRGVVFPVPVTIKGAAGGEVTGSIMIRGTFHYEDVSSDGGTTAEIKTKLQTQSPSMRELGLNVQGLKNIR